MWLELEAVKDFLTENKRPLDGVSFEVLRIIPMMLTMYTETSAIRKQLQDKKHYQFKRDKTKGELIYNYLLCLLCQLASCELNGRPDEILHTWDALFGVAPYIAYKMELNGTFRINKDDLFTLVSDYKHLYKTERHKSNMTKALWDMTHAALPLLCRQKMF